jgi:anti-sigma-K factor RskA
MAYSEDHIALAAEYAVGTLDAEERAQVEAMMSVDKDFTSMVEAWEQKLGVLNQMVGSVEPRPIVWENIKAAIGHSDTQAALVLPASPPVPASDIVQPEVVQPEALRPEALQPEALRPEFLPSEFMADNANVIQLSAQARRWRHVATAMSAIAAALVAMFTIGIYQPDLLPDGLRPKPRTRFVEVRAPATQPAPPSAQYVAVLQKQGGAPAFILTVDGATKNFTIRKVDAPPEAGKSFELWLISDRLPKPRSLGVIGSGDFTARPVLAAYDADTINTATYAVTIEQAGGSPDGNPHSTPVFTGKLLETVPPPTQAPSQPRLSRLLSPPPDKKNTPVGSGRFR